MHSILNRSTTLRINMSEQKNSLTSLLSARELLEEKIAAFKKNRPMYVVEHPSPGVIHLVFTHQKDLSFGMCRLEEFYEGPHAHIKGQYFSLETFFDTYCDDSGDLAYYYSWDGFNVPRHAIDKFEELFTPHGLTRREQLILDEVKKHDAQYLIATSISTIESTVDHEVAHALWATNPEYKQKCQEALKSMTNVAKKYFTRLLLSEGYPSDPAIMEDEHHAYIATASVRYVKRIFGELGKVHVDSVFKARQLLKEALPENVKQPNPDNILSL